MAFVLSERARRAGYRLHARETVGSSNAEALAAARQGDPGPLWIAAREQTEGRGRRGSTWATARGNLAASCLLSRHGATHLATLGFVAGLALHDALVELASDARGDGNGPSSATFRLKWPNDVLADGAKLSGILLESERVAEDRLAVVTGIGVNVLTAPEGLPYPTTSLKALGMDCSAETLFAALTDHWCRHEELWDAGQGLPAIRAAWLARAAGLGEAAAVTVGGVATRGVFETIDEDCRLVLRAPDGSRVHVSAGDVHFGTAGSHRDERKEI